MHFPSLIPVPLVPEGRMRVSQPSTTGSLQKAPSGQRQTLPPARGAVLARVNNHTQASTASSTQLGNGLLASVQKSMAGAGAAVMLLSMPAPCMAEEADVAPSSTQTIEGATGMRLWCSITTPLAPSAKLGTWLVLVMCARVLFLGWSGLCCDLARSTVNRAIRPCRE